MISLTNNCYIIDLKDCTNDISYINFDLKSKFNFQNFALKIDFKNDFEYSIKVIKKLELLEKSNINFCTNINNKKIKYIISNYSDEVIDALKSINIPNEKEKISFIYDSIFNSLDKIWAKNNPCNFCNNYCEAARNHRYVYQDDGCCYSFEYDNRLFSTSLIKNKQKCKYLGKDKRCTTKNLSCKFFTCKYLKNQKNFKLNPNNFLLYASLLNKKQKLIIMHNYFHSKEEIINKMIEKNKTPYLIYNLKCNYYIDK